MCIRDEEAFLAANLAYHQALGITGAYLFLDRCTDASEAIAQRFPWVKVIQRDRDPEDRFMSAHQVKCMAEGRALARTDGFEWILHLDADELASGDGRPAWRRRLARLRGETLPERLERAALPNLLSTVRHDTEAVVLSTEEAVFTPLSDGEPFWRLPYVHARGPLRRRLLDPTTGEIVRMNVPIGHSKGKAIVRTDAEIEPVNAHHWRRAEGSAPVRAEHRGMHYHYPLVGAGVWLEKYRKFAEYPAYWEKGTPVRFPKQAWKEASLRMTDAEAEAYFRQWLTLTPRRLLLARLSGRVVYDPFVREVLAALPPSEAFDPARPVPGLSLSS